MSDSAAVVTQVKSLLSEISGMAVPDIDAGAYVAEYMTSLKLLELRDSLERTMQVHFSDRVWGKLRSVNDIAANIREQWAARGINR